MQKKTSPVPHKGTAITMTFADAIAQILDSKRITRLEWNTNDEWGFLGKDGFLSIHKDGIDHHWLVSDGDMLASDWCVLPE